jgi:hypothetical protein
MKKIHFAIVCLLLCALSAPGWAQQTVFNGVKTRFSKSPTDRRLVDKDADLIFDDSARKLTVKNQERPLSVAYDDIQKVVFDVSTHMRGGGMAEALSAFGVAGAITGSAIASKHVNDYWCYLEYKTPDGAVHDYMLEVPKKSSPAVIEKMQALFKEKVTTAEFPQLAADVQKDTLKDLQSKHDLKVDKKNHPMPELKPDKALLVVVCPPLAARYEGAGFQAKLHANDHVVAVNKMGTYTFAYLDPGDYMLVSQTENARGFHMTLEAGKEYYFLQDTFMGAWKSHTSLSRHTKELALYEVGGAYYSDWKRK